jgi:hypothetical protein
VPGGHDVDNSANWIGQTGPVWRYAARKSQHQGRTDPSVMAGTLKDVDSLYQRRSTISSPAVGDRHLGWGLLLMSRNGSVAEGFSTRFTAADEMPLTVRDAETHLGGRATGRTTYLSGLDEPLDGELFETARRSAHSKPMRRTSEQ